MINYDPLIFKKQTIYILKKYLLDIKNKEKNEIKKMKRKEIIQQIIKSDTPDLTDFKYFLDNINKKKKLLEKKDIKEILQCKIFFNYDDDNKKNETYLKLDYD